MRGHKLNKMEISITFTQEELRLIARSLTFGIIHTNNNNEVQRMKELDQKINIIGAIQQGKL